MMLGARTAAWAKSGGGVPTARDYVQDGLIAMWDGIENAGWGVHDGASTEWVDLVGGADFTLTENGSFDESSFVCNGLSAKGDGISLGLGYTIECVTYAYSVAGYRCVFNLDRIRMRKSFVFYREYCHITGGGSQFGTPPVSVGAHSWSAVVVEPLLPSSYHLRMFTSYFIDGQMSDEYETGNWAGTWKSTDYSDFASIGCLNLNGSDVYPFTGRIHSIRAYNRSLTLSEVAANYAIDKARFNLQ